MSAIASQADLSPTTAYWDEFYSGRKGSLSVPRYPSQFAAFVVNELNNVQAIIEFGCGNGRDSEFFAGYGLNVLSMDASLEAIQVCRASTSSSNVRYVHLAANDAGPLVDEYLSSLPPGISVAVYARFFLHAITADEQCEFISMLETSLPKGAWIFLEYRTEQDEAHRKEFGQHYRRFLSHRSLMKSLADRGFIVQYEIEGRGLAKYKDEDALVGRCIVQKV